MEQGNGQGDSSSGDPHAECARTERRLRGEFQEFVNILSHDLKEPLRAVVSYLRLLEVRTGQSLDTDSREFIDFAMKGARRLQKMIEQLLVFSRVESRGTAPEWVDSGKILEQVVRSLEARVQELGGTVEGEGLPRLRVDPYQFETLLGILIENAVDYRGEAPPRIRVAVREGEDVHEFRVEDNGKGIDPSNLGRVFGAFQRVDGGATEEHTGMGLAIAKRIVERAGGRIWAESRPGEGSSFHFTIPRAVEP